MLWSDGKRQWQQCITPKIKSTKMFVFCFIDVSDDDLSTSCKLLRFVVDIDFLLIWRYSFLIDPNNLSSSCRFTFTSGHLKSRSTKKKKSYLKYYTLYSINHRLFLIWNPAERCDFTVIKFYQANNRGFCNNSKSTATDRPGRP